MVGKFASLLIPPLCPGLLRSGWADHQQFWQCHLVPAPHYIGIAHTKAHSSNHSTYPVILSFTSVDDHSSQHRNVIYFIPDNTFTCFSLLCFFPTFAHSSPPQFCWNPIFVILFVEVFLCYAALFVPLCLYVYFLALWALHAQTHFVSSIRLII